MPYVIRQVHVLRIKITPRFSARVQGPFRVLLLLIQLNHIKVPRKHFWVQVGSPLRLHLPMFFRVKHGLWAGISHHHFPNNLRLHHLSRSHPGQQPDFTIP